MDATPGRPPTATGPPSGRGRLFTERLLPSAATWLLVPGAGLAAVLLTWPLGAVLSAAAALGAVAAALAGLLAASPRVEVVGGQLRAGRAHVPVTLLGPAVAARGEQARQERGPRLDARAHLLVRGWVDPVVRVPLRDPDDPTPYWLVSTRAPEALVDALARAAGRAG